NGKKTYTPEAISSKRSVLEDRLIGGRDDEYDDSVQKLIDIGKKGSGANSQVEKLWRLGVLSPRSGGQNSRPDCRRCRRSARQLSDLELSFLDLFRQFDAADRDCRRVESLEPQHRHNPLFYPSMILLHDIVQIFAGSDPHTTRHATLGFQFPDGPMRSGIGVESDHAWRSIVSDCFVEETLGGGHIPTFAQQKVHCSPVFVDRSIKIGPAPLHLYIGLVTSPGTINISSVAAPALFELRNIALHPSQDRCVSQDNSAFGHHPD